MDDLNRKLPNFVYAGFPKTGSATITEILKRQPDIYTTRQNGLESMFVTYRN